jgi:hypothetical protein
VKIAACLFLVMVLPAISGSRESTRPKADELWAHALAAKGGAERLHAIRNFVVTESYEATKLREFGGSRQRHVIVGEPPGKWWISDDYRPGKLGFSVQLINVAKGLDLYSSGEGSRSAYSAVGYEESKFERVNRLQAVYFTETAALRPTVVSAEVIKGFDVVHTDIDGYRVSFYLDRQTHLPAHVEELWSSPTTREKGLKPLRYWYTLERYLEVAGLKIPARVALGGDFANATVEVNLDLDETLFDTLPDGVATSDWWLRYRRPPTTVRSPSPSPEPRVAFDDKCPAGIGVRRTKGSPKNSPWCSDSR